MNKERLLNVAKALRESKNPRGFTMNVVHKCGTPACAIGHYAARRDLQEEIQLPSSRSDNGSLIIGVWGAAKLTGGWTRFVSDHFDIEPEQVDELFGFSGCGKARTAIQAAKYIERLVADAA